MEWTVCYSALKEEDVLPCVTAGTDLEDVMLCEISQAQKVKYCMMVAPT